MKKRRVVVTGIGLTTPYGAGRDMFWRGVCDGAVVTKEIERFPTDDYRSRMGGEVPGFDDWGVFGAERRTQARATRLAVAAAREAAQDAALGYDDFQTLQARAAVVMGTVMGNRAGLEAWVARLKAGVGSRGTDELGACEQSLIAERPAIHLGISGGAVVLPNACAAGNSALACGADWIDQGDADVVLAGGADELCPAMFVMFSLFNSLAPDVVRPFDRHRQGLLLSEGAGVLVLEAEEHARARSARIYGYVAGHGDDADAYDIAHPHPEGAGAARAMRQAMRAANLQERDVDWICAHGTGTVANDPSEARAVRSAFGAAADGIPVSSLKSMIGHCQGAAPAIEAAACLLALRDGVIPPTMNHRETDPRCQIDVVPNKARKGRVQAVLNNAFGLGGSVSCVAFTAA